MKKKPTVSLCMIVKNEENTILSCLNSVMHLVDEIVVVDTGSADRTPGLAAAAGAKVFNFRWTGDFSRARNFALEQAASDWVMVLDADEVLEPVSAEKFNRLLCADGVEGYFLHVKSYLGAGREVTWDRVVRLFKNNPLYRFKGAIHEQVASSILDANRGAGLATAPLVINHYGYLDAQIAQKDKYNRNTLIINRELKSKPDDPFLLYCLAVEHYQRDEVCQGLACLEKALGKMRGTEGYFENVIVNIALGLLKIGKLVKLINFVNKSLEMLPGQADLILARGLGYLCLGRYPEAVVDLERALQIGSSEIFPDFRILSFLGDAQNLLGNYRQAERSYLSALHQSYKYLYPLTQMLGIIQRGRGTVDFKQISLFAPMQKKEVLWKELFAAGEIPLAMVILLLSIYDMAGGGAQNNAQKKDAARLSKGFSSMLARGDAQGNELVWLGKEFSGMLARVQPLSGRDVSASYAAATAREICTYAQLIAKGYDCCGYPAKKRLGSLVEKALFLVISEFCPQWSPAPFLLSCNCAGNLRICYRSKKQAKANYFPAGVVKHYGGAYL